VAEFEEPPEGVVTETNCAAAQALLIEGYRFEQSQPICDPPAGAAAECGRELLCCTSPRLPSRFAAELRTEGV
jgi:hypothetical protein